MKLLLTLKSLLALTISITTNFTTAAPVTNANTLIDCPDTSNAEFDYVVVYVL